jgi:hypothetical protein
VADITFDTAYVFVRHKQDVDEFEDGCITEIEIYLTYGSGCTLHLIANDRYVWQGGLAIDDIIFTADSACPGFADANEGTYSGTSGMLKADILPDVKEVPDYNVSESCVETELTISLQGTIAREYDSAQLAINSTEIVISGEYPSEGFTTGVCPCEGSCSGAECGDDGCGGSCGQCLATEDCYEGSCIKTWHDTSSGLTWQVVDPATEYTWAAAATDCSGLVLDSYSDWLLPTIDDLRSIIRGCAANETGGDCGVTDPACLDYSSCDTYCDYCNWGYGPGPNGCYSVDQLSGACSGYYGYGYYWSSSSTTYNDMAWVVRYSTGSLTYAYKTDSESVRCVRP